MRVPSYVAAGAYRAAGVPRSMPTCVQAVPDHSRAQAVGLASAALRLAQGIGIVGAGLLAQLIAPGAVIMVIAAGGAVLALATAAAWSRATAVAGTSRA